MNIGLVDVDGHNFPNFALMRLSACYKAKGHRVEWAAPRQRYDKVLASKVFTFTPDYDYDLLDVGEVVRGGTGYDIAGRLPEAVENSRMMDYSIYPEYLFRSSSFQEAASASVLSASSVRKKDTFRPWNRWN